MDTTGNAQSGGGSGCDHHHGPGGHSHGPASGIALTVSLVATVIFVAVEAVVGRISHSLALVSDAGHNFSDALSLGLSAYAIWVARRPANASKTFGYHRVAILTALLNSAMLAFIAIAISVEAVQAIGHPHPIDSRLMVVTATVALVLNGGITWALHGGAKNSLNVRAAYIHMATDVISSVMVLATAYAIRLTGLTILDPIASLLIAAVIFGSCWGILREATTILLEAAPRGLDLDSLVSAVAAVPHVRALHDLHVWTVSDGLNYLSCHIEVADTRTMAECSEILRQVNAVLLIDFKIAHSTIQVEMAGACVSAESSDPLYCGGMTPAKALR